MSKIKTLYGVDFELITPKTRNMEAFINGLSKTQRTLSDCYAKPSQAKRNIYAWWKCWFSQLALCDGVKVVRFNGVSSFNVHRFSLSGVLTYYGEDYIIEITQTHKRLIKVIV